VERCPRECTRAAFTHLFHENLDVEGGEVFELLTWFVHPELDAQRIKDVALFLLLGLSEGDQTFHRRFRLSNNLMERILPTL